MIASRAYFQHLVCAAQAFVDAPEEGLARLSGQAPQVGCTDAPLVEDAADIAVISCSVLESLCFVFVFGTFTCEVLEYYLSPVRFVHEEHGACSVESPSVWTVTLSRSLALAL